MFRAILITDSKPNEFSIRIQLPFLFSLVTVYITNSVILSKIFLQFCLLKLMCDAMIINTTEANCKRDMINFFSLTRLYQIFKMNFFTDYGCGCLLANPREVGRNQGYGCPQPVRSLLN